VDWSEQVNDCDEYDDGRQNMAKGPNLFNSGATISFLM
jgi:hypothetical protein